MITGHFRVPVNLIMKARLSAKFFTDSDQHQISPSNINAYSTPEVMKIKYLITQGEFSWYFNNFFQDFYKKTTVLGQGRRICSLILEVKGLRYDSKDKRKVNPLTPNHTHELKKKDNNNNKK